MDKKRKRERKPLTSKDPQNIFDDLGRTLIPGIRRLRERRYTEGFNKFANENSNITSPDNFRAAATKAGYSANDENVLTHMGQLAATQRAKDAAAQAQATQGLGKQLYNHASLAGFNGDDSARNHQYLMMGEAMQNGHTASPEYKRVMDLMNGGTTTGDKIAIENNKHSNEMNKSTLDAAADAFVNRSKNQNVSFTGPDGQAVPTTGQTLKDFVNGEAGTKFTTKDATRSTSTHHTYGSGGKGRGGNSTEKDTETISWKNMNDLQDQLNGMVKVVPIKDATGAVVDQQKVITDPKRYQQIKDNLSTTTVSHGFETVGGMTYKQAQKAARSLFGKVDYGEVQDDTWSEGKLNISNPRVLEFIIKGISKNISLPELEEAMRKREKAAESQGTTPPDHYGVLQYDK